MSKRLVSRMLGMFQSRKQVGVDKAGNRYFTLVEVVDGVMKEKRWVEFKGDQEPTIVPVEWICWLNDQRKKAPTPEMVLAEADPQTIWYFKLHSQYARITYRMMLSFLHIQK